MEDVSSLLQRIRGAFTASQEKMKQFQTQQVSLHHEREQRLERLEKIFDQLREVWRPRLDSLAKEFGDRVQLKPMVTPGLRQAVMSFKSPLASINLKFSATTDLDVTRLVLSSDLDILPILMHFQPHAEISFPLDQVDSKAIGQWLDDQIVQFVKTYLSLHENEYYLKHHMVEDPIAHVRFPKFAAGATRQLAGKPVFFISEETAQEFDRQKK